jgi:uncharacterized protein
MTDLPVTPLTRVRRHPERGSQELELMYRILDEGYVCHVAFVHEGQPIALPMAYVRVDDRIYVHGSSKNHMLNVLAGGVPACLEVTLLDGLVLARSQFSHSMNYRSVVVFGRAEVVDEPEPKRAALAAMCDRLAPGRSREARPPTLQELKATLVLALPIREASAKQRAGSCLDGEEDLSSPCWAGVLPLTSGLGAPEPDPRLAPDTPLALSVRRLLGAAAR